MMPISHTKNFGIYHWDTFDNETFLIDQADTLEEAEEIIKEKYKGRIGVHGADQVDIVDSKGDIVKKYSVS